MYHESDPITLKLGKAALGDVELDFRVLAEQGCQP